MEPVIAFNILNEIKDKGYGVRKIEKCSDRNRTVKNFMNTLYVSQNEKQIQKSLSTSTKSHLKKCFTYSVCFVKE